MKLPVSKSNLLAGGGVLLIGGFILAAELKSKGPDAASDSTLARGRKAARGSAPASSGPVKATGCPGEVTVEDPAIKVSPDFIKERFATKTCSRIGGGQLNGCLDKDEEACKKRLEGIARILKNPGDCLPRPAEMFCSVHTLADEKTTTACFETQQACDAYHEKKRNRPKICRTAPACEKVTLPPL